MVNARVLGVGVQRPKRIDRRIGYFGSGGMRRRLVDLDPPGESSLDAALRRFLHVVFASSRARTGGRRPVIGFRWLDEGPMGSGGVTATVLWELTRHVLVWYFARLSMANLIYGSMATVIVVLLTLEAAAVILLLGAQVIAEIDRARTAVPEAAGAATGR